MVKISPTEKERREPYQDLTGSGIRFLQPQQSQ